MSLWTFREGWPADRVNHVFLLRAVDKVGATLFGEWWRPPSQGPFEGHKTARRVARFGKDWLATERFRDVRILMAKACEANELQSVYFKGNERMEMGSGEWALEDVSAYFEQGHIFLPDGTFPIFVREPDLDRYIAELVPAPAAPPEGEPVSAPPREETAPKPRFKPKVDPIIEVLKEIYPPHGDVPDSPYRSDEWLLGRIEKHDRELEDTFSPDSVSRARKLTRKAALDASEK
jgi:hypothetical protein